MFLFHFCMCYVFPFMYANYGAEGRVVADLQGIPRSASLRRHEVVDKSRSTAVPKQPLCQKA